MSEEKKILTEQDRKCLQKAYELYCDKKYDEARKIFKKYGEMDADASFYLGVMYGFGYGVNEDSKQAAYWYHISAELGHRGAMYNLGVSYKTGDGIKQDDKQAAYWYGRAAELGHAIATNNLGACYEWGQGVETNLEKALELYEKAAKEEDEYGLWNLGRLYEEGKGVKTNLNKALELYDLADVNGHPNAKKDADRIREKERKNSEENEIVAADLEKLSKYHLNKNSIETLRRAFKILYRREERKANTKIFNSSGGHLSCNFLIHCEDPVRSRLFIKDFASVLLELISKTNSDEEVKTDEMVSILSEQRFLNNSENILNVMKEKNIVAIYDCCQRLSRNSGAIWEQFLQSFDDTSSVCKIISASEDVIRCRFKDNEHLYYRLFRNHIYVDNMSKEEVYDRTTNLLGWENLHSSDEFNSGLKEYIDTVYKSADLKNQQFINDLVQRILLNYYGEEETMGVLTEKQIPFYRKKLSSEQAEKAFDDLVGMENVKETFEELKYMVQENAGGAVPALHMAFVGNPGTGKTTVAQMAADLLYSIDVIQSNKVVSVSALDLIGEFVGQTAGRTRSYCQKAYGGILFIDEAYSIAVSGSGSKQNGTDQFRQECIATLLQEMENNRDRLMVILAGYPKEMDDFLHKSNSGFASRIYKVVEFEDYTEEQLMEIFQRLCKKEHYCITIQALERVRLKLSALRYSRDFGNARTVRNVFMEAKRMCNQEHRSGQGQKIIEARHVALETELKDFDTLNAELNAMIGLQSAKHEIQSAIATSRFAKESGLEVPISRHMLFIGNAGTGKSTVANLFCKMLYSVGAAKSPNCVSIAAGDLLGRANPVEELQEYCVKASGGVLFIDEAYAFQAYPAYCASCIAVLLDVMEKQRDELTIILAGYAMEMNDFLNQNQGLKSRFPITVPFEDYSIEELKDIFVSLCESYHFTVTPEAIETFKEVINVEQKYPNFGNARTVRNVFERSYRRHAENFMANRDEAKRLVMDAADII